MWTALTPEGVEVFGLAVYQCIQRWTALQLAVHNEWGGPASASKCQQLLSDVVAFFTGSKVQRYFDELEDLLDQRMLEFFNTEIEDGSLFEVAEQLMTMHEQCMLGNFENVRRMSTPAPGTGQSIQLSTPDDNDNTKDDHQAESDETVDYMNVEYPVPANGPASSYTTENQTSSLTQEEVADGWQAVPSRKGRRGKAS